MKINELLEEQGFLLADGAMGTELFASGLEAGMAPEILNTNNPKWNEIVFGVHERYLLAGSDLILTNTFGGNEFRLGFHDLDDLVTDVNRSAARIARRAVEALDRPAFVAGSMGPTGALLEPLGNLTPQDVEEAYAIQAEGLAEGGVDILWLETFSDLAEVENAIKGVRKVSDLPLVATMSYDTAGHTMMGISGTQQGELIKTCDLFAIGANCGADIEDTTNATKAMRNLCKDTVIVFKPNAGIPEWHGAELEYTGTPEMMADVVAEVVKDGLTIVGGCCGSTPEHIKAMRAKLSV